MARLCKTLQGSNCTPVNFLIIIYYHLVSHLVESSSYPVVRMLVSQARKLPSRRNVSLAETFLNTLTQTQGGPFEEQTWSYLLPNVEMT